MLCSFSQCIRFFCCYQLTVYTHTVFWSRAAISDDVVWDNQTYISSFIAWKAVVFFAVKNDALYRGWNVDWTHFIMKLVRLVIRAEAFYCMLKEVIVWTYHSKLEALNFKQSYQSYSSLSLTFIGSFFKIEFCGYEICTLWPTSVSGDLIKKTLKKKNSSEPQTSSPCYNRHFMARLTTLWQCSSFQYKSRFPLWSKRDSVQIFNFFIFILSSQ